MITAVVRPDPTATHYRIWFDPIMARSITTEKAPLSFQCDFFPAISGTEGKVNFIRVLNQPQWDDPIVADNLTDKDGLIIGIPLYSNQAGLDFESQLGFRIEFEMDSETFPPVENTITFTCTAIG